MVLRKLTDFKKRVKTNYMKQLISFMKQKGQVKGDSKRIFSQNILPRYFLESEQKTFYLLPSRKI